MRGCLSLIFRIVAVILAALFVATALASLVLANVGWWLFNADTYKRVLASVNIYENLPEIVAGQMESAANFNPCRDNPSDPRCLSEGQPAPEGDEGQSEEGGPPPMFARLTTADWEFLLTELLAPSWTQAQVETILDQTFAWLDSDDPRFAPTISIVEFKRRLAGEQGQRAALRLIRSMPPCAAEEAPAIDSPGGLTCRPPESVLADPAFTSQIEQGLEKAAAGMPDEVVIGGGEEEQESPATAGENNLFGRDPRLAARTMRDAFRLSPLLPALLLALVALFGVRSRRGLMRWWGIPLSVAGALGAAIAIALTPVILWATETYLLPRFPMELSPRVHQMIRDLVAGISGQVALPLGVEAVILLAVGAVLWIVSGRAAPVREASTQPPAPNLPTPSMS